MNIKNTISVSMIVKNESLCLAKALESVKEADEIIVFDTGSTDNTIDIAKRYTNLVYTDYKWEDHFAKARNHSLSKCTKEWVLIIDADEVLEPGGISKIRKLLNSGKVIGNSTVYFNVTAIANPNQKHKAIRLFKRNAGIFWKGAAHNYLSESKGFISDIELFYGYSEAHKQDPNRTLRILQKAVNENPKLSRETFYLAREYWYRKNYKKTISYYSEFLKQGKWGPEIAEAQLMISKCWMHLGNLYQSRKWCFKAITTNANFKEAFLVMAKLSGPKNAKRWKEIANTANNEDVLFVR